MKKEFMASVLTFTAGMASTVSFPQYALATPNYKIEKSYPKKFKLVTKAPARYTDDNGRVIQGHIYIKLDQTPFSPSGQNQLEGEMSGYFFFISDENTETNGAGEGYKTWVSMVGDDGESLLDLVNRTSEDGRKYQIYGCNSSLSYCNSATYELIFGGSMNNHPIQLSFDIPEDARIQILTSRERVEEWSRSGVTEMVQTNNGDF